MRESLLAPDPELRDERVREIALALDHIERTGTLADFAATRSRRLALIAIASSRWLICWNPRTEKYELTRSGRALLPHAAPALRPTGERYARSRLPLAAAIAAGMAAMVPLVLVSATDLSSSGVSRVVKERVRSIAVSARQPVGAGGESLPVRLAATLAPAPSPPVVAHDEAEPPPLAASHLADPAAGLKAPLIEKKKTAKPRPQHRPQVPTYAVPRSYRWDPCATGCG